MQVLSLGQEDPLEKEIATHSSIVAWEIPWSEEPGGLQSMGSKESKHDLTTKPLPRVISNMEGTERKRNGQRETLRCRMGTVTASSNLTGNSRTRTAFQIYPAYG